MKTKIFKTLAAALAVSSMLASSGGQVYAAVDSTKDVATPSTESCNVSATLETLWSVNIPKHVTLDVDSAAKTGAADYTVSVRGQIEPSHSITVEPDSSFAMSCDDVSLTATVAQEVTSFSGKTLTLDTPSTTSGNIAVSGLKGGTYSGNFNFHIAEEAGTAGHTHNYVNGKCTECGEIDPNHEHSYSETVTKQPTCTEAGEKTLTCVCGDSHTETLETTPHDYVNDKCADCGILNPNHQHEYSNGVCSCGDKDPSDSYALAPEGSIENWSYELDDANDVVTLKHYDGDETNVTVYANYPVNDKTYHTVLKSSAYESGYGTRGIFTECSGVETISFSKNIDTSNMTNMANMFSKCSSLTSLDLSSFDTSNVTNMGGMFQSCSLLKSVDLSSFDTSNVIMMSNMFNYCTSLANLDLSSFDTHNVTTISDMFVHCSSLTSLDLSNFNTSNVTRMGSMFADCSSLMNLNVSSFDTSNVTTMTNMFVRCSSLGSLDVSNFNTSNLKDMNHMFNGCSSLKSLDLSNFDTSKVTTMRGTFQDDASLISIYVTDGKWVTSQVTDSTDMFKNCGTKSVTYR